MLPKGVPYYIVGVNMTYPCLGWPCIYVHIYAYTCVCVYICVDSFGSGRGLVAHVAGPFLEPTVSLIPDADHRVFTYNNMLFYFSEPLYGENNIYYMLLIMCFRLSLFRFAGNPYNERWRHGVALRGGGSYEND